MLTYYSLYAINIIGRRDVTCPIMPRAATGGAMTTEGFFFTLISPDGARLHAGFLIS